MNYDKEMLNTIKNLDYKPRLLLHSCCAPCSSYVISYLSDYFDITIYYYNPNIEPLLEYEKRKSEQIRFVQEFKGNNKLEFLDCDYENVEFRKCAENLEEEREGGLRCLNCFRLRLTKTCDKAKDLDYDYFGTTLTVSPHKNSKVINELGLSLNDTVKFLVSDFKKNDGYKKSIELSKKYDLYRQDYCGCIFSKVAKEKMQHEREINI